MDIAVIQVSVLMVHVYAMNMNVMPKYYATRIVVVENHDTIVKS